MRWIMALALALCAWAQESVAQAQSRGQVQEIVAPAPSLDGNRLGTPAEQHVSVYLPPSYGRGARRYPVIYLLHGIADSRRTWLTYIGVQGILDRAIAARRIPEAIVVMPDAGNIYGGGFYRDSPVSGGWETYIADDLVHYVDAHYRTLARAGGRAVVGWSMGGYGAIHIAMDRPGLFAAAYGISPCCLAPVEDLGGGNDAWRRALAMQSPADIQAAAQNNDFYPVAIMGILSAFSPAPDSPPFFVRFPYRIDEAHQVAPDPRTYEAWAAAFPVNEIDRARAALLGLRAFGIDYGVGDQYAHIPAATRLFSDRLTEARIPHRFEVYDGDHRTKVAQRLETVVLPYVANALDPPE